MVTTQILKISAIIVMMALTIAHQTAGIQSTCVAGNVTEGEDVNVTCYFANDLRELQLDVNVNQFYPKEETILRCAWFDGEPDIVTLPGVKSLGSISNKLTLTITQANKEKFDGKYMCQVAKSSPEETLPCALHIIRIPFDNQTSRITSNGTTTSTFSDQKTSKEQLDIIIGTLISVIFAPIIVMAIILWFRMRKRKTKRHNSSPSDQEYPLNSEKRANGVQVSFAKEC